MTNFPHLSPAIDKRSFIWLDENEPDISAAVQYELNDGRTPEEIRRFVMRRTQREAIALRCEQAARYLQRVGE